MYTCECKDDRRKDEYIQIDCTVSMGKNEVKSECVIHSVVSDSATPWTVALQASLSMKFSKLVYRGVYPFPSPEDLCDPRVQPRSPALQTNSLLSEAPRKPICACARARACVCVSH